MALAEIASVDDAASQHAVVAANDERFVDTWYDDLFTTANATDLLAFPTLFQGGKSIKSATGAVGTTHAGVFESVYDWVQSTALCTAADESDAVTPTPTTISAEPSSQPTGEPSATPTEPPTRTPTVTPTEAPTESSVQYSSACYTAQVGDGFCDIWNNKAECSYDAGAF